ncbi:MAG: hypothetical protein ABR514_00845 [Chthoniobacterales bacterium]
MNAILLFFAIPAALCLTGCGFSGATEEAGEPQAGRTMYRAPAGSEIGETIPTPAPQKVPGESH